MEREIAALLCGIVLCCIALKLNNLADSGFISWVEEKQILRVLFEDVALIDDWLQTTSMINKTENDNPLLLEIHRNFM